MPNIGSLDRILRGVAGLALVAIPLMPQSEHLFDSWGPWEALLPAVGLFVLATSVASFCPFYMAMDISTCRPGEDVDRS